MKKVVKTTTPRCGICKCFYSSSYDDGSGFSKQRDALFGSENYNASEASKVKTYDT